MEQVMAVAIGIVFAAAVYMMLRRSISKLIIGLLLLNHAANLLIFVVAGMSRGAPPLISKVSLLPGGTLADPLPQALILTAIVISFGVLSFAVVLIHRAHRVVGSDDLDQMKGTDI